MSKEAIAKVNALDKWKQVKEELETPGGRRYHHGIVKARDKASKDYTHIKHIRGWAGTVPMDEDKIRERWGEYFEPLLNEENPRKVLGDEVPN